MRHIVYLAGAINGCSDAVCKDWREYVKTSLNGKNIDFLDPMRRDYRGIEEGNVGAIVNGDYDDIDSSDVMLANANTPSWGTAMEIHYAFENGTYVILVCDKDKPSPWLKYHSHEIHKTLDEAIKSLATLKIDEEDK